VRCAGGDSVVCCMGEWGIFFSLALVERGESSMENRTMVWKSEVEVDRGKSRRKEGVSRGFEMERGRESCIWAVGTWV